MGKKLLLQEDFQGFPAGDFPYEPFLGAMGEYHYRPLSNMAGEWYDPTPLMFSGGVKTWMVLETDGMKCIEYSTTVKEEIDSLVILAAGEADWTDYSLSGKVRLLLSRSCAGLIFRYQNSLCFYMLCFNYGKLQLFKRNQTGITVLAEKEYPYNADQFYHFYIECRGKRLRCRVNDELQFEAEDETYPCGRIAIGTLAPAQFTAIRVEAEAETITRSEALRRKEAAETEAEVAKHPQPKLWKTIDLQNFGAGRSLRFGHLRGGSEFQMVIAQCQRRISRDAFARISCLTAFDLEGERLWQLGEANPKHAFLTADLPFQLYDIDGDGYDEVILARDFKLEIRDGRSGELKKEAFTPRMERPEYPFDRLNVDAIRLCDLSGKGRPTDLIIKDRYRQIWAYNSDLEPLWSYKAPVNTGHFPFTHDVNGDGREEVFVGYDLLDADGRRIWSLPIDTDHTDEIVIGPIDPERSELIAIVSGSEGFILADLEGRILCKQIIGHAQRISVGNYRPELPGLEIAVGTYWSNQGIIYLYDCKGRLLWSKERRNNGNLLTPVNWSGDGRDLILLNGSHQHGGLIDGEGRRVVLFPDDGHPELCAEAIDLDGDGRDELVLWDEKHMSVYSQDQPVPDFVTRRRKYPHCNASNYRGEYSFPVS